MKLETLQELVTTLYSEVLNPKLDCVEDVYLENNGELTVAYFYDGELDHQKFTSFEEFLLTCSKYGNFNVTL